MSYFRLELLNAQGMILRTYNVVDIVSCAKIVADVQAGEAQSLHDTDRIAHTLQRERYCDLKSEYYENTRYIARIVEVRYLDDE